VHFCGLGKGRYHVVTFGGTEMMKGILLSLLVIGCLLIWILIVVPLVAKSFRAPYRFGTLPFHRRNQALSRWQSFWFAGVLGWGGTVFLSEVLIRYFDDFSKFRTHQVLLWFAVSSISGGLLSLWIRHDR
jgi:hypothetical protein